MFISGSQQSYKHTSKLCDKIRKNRPWSELYKLKYNIFQSFEINFDLAHSFDEKGKKTGSLRILSDSSYLQFDQFFVFKKKDTTTNIDDDELIYDISLVARIENDKNGDYQTYSKSDDFKLYVEDDLVYCESELVSYPQNLSSGQNNRYYIHITYNSDKLEFYYILQSAIKVGRCPIYWGKDQQHFFKFHESTYEKNISSFNYNKDCFVCIKEYCISIPKDFKLFSSESDRGVPDMVMNIENFLKNEECDIYRSIIDNAENFTIIDDSIMSVIIPVNIGRINDNFVMVDKARILKYDKSVGCSPHVDVPEFDPKSTHRILVYLNSDFEGGYLRFLNTESIGGIQEGKAIIFNLNRYHYADKIKEGCKYILTGELIYSPMNNC